MKPTHARALDILKARDGKATDVVLQSTQVCRVLNIAWGYDLGTNVAHITTNVSPGPEEDHRIDFFHADEITQIIDPLDKMLLFSIDEAEAG